MRKQKLLIVLAILIVAGIAGNVFKQEPKSVTTFKFNPYQIEDQQTFKSFQPVSKI
jgi:hypothetical protein